MINVLFFAHLKETLNCEQIQVEAADVETVAKLREVLSEKGEQWAKSLSSGATLTAVNQAMAKDETALKAGDEVAFFPPVTGG